MLDVYDKSIKSITLETENIQFFLEMFYYL